MHTVHIQYIISVSRARYNSKKKEKKKSDFNIWKGNMRSSGKMYHIGNIMNVFHEDWYKVLH